MSWLTANFLEEVLVNKDEQAIRDLVAKWHQATASGDIDALLPLMATDVVFLAAGRSPMRGRDTFADGFRSILKTHRIESSSNILEVQVSGELAYCWSMLNVRVIPFMAGEIEQRSGHVLSVLRRTLSGPWQIVRDANLLAAQH